MGIYYLIANLDKQQYINPSDFGEDPRWYWVLTGFHAMAIAQLVCHGARESPCGSWAGDRVCLIRDNEDPNDHGIQTTREDMPQRNLYKLAHEEWENLAEPCLLMLLGWREEMVDSLAEQVARNPYHGKQLLLRLGNILLSNHAEEFLNAEDENKLEKALVSHVGPDWKEHYLNAKADYERWGKP